MDGCGPRSTGTILPNIIVQWRYESVKDGKWDYRLHFMIVLIVLQVENY
jgi:hypothetical protein